MAIESRAIGSRLSDIIKNSGRLRHEDGAVLARALLLVLERRSRWPVDPEEALVAAVASIRVMEGKRQ